MAHVFKEVSVIPFLFLTLSNILWFCYSSFQTERHLSNLGFVRCCLLALFIPVQQLFCTSMSSPPAPAVALVLVCSTNPPHLGHDLIHSDNNPYYANAKCTFCHWLSSPAKPISQPALLTSHHQIKPNIAVMDLEIFLCLPSLSIPSEQTSTLPVAQAYNPFQFHHSSYPHSSCNTTWHTIR